jgi:cytochrome c
MRSTIRLAAVVFAVSSAVSFAAEVDKKTERTWKSKCASCHGADGKGQTEQGKKMKVADMSTAGWQKDVTEERMKKAMNEGIKEQREGVKQEMESFKDTLKPEQMEALVGYMRTLGPQK